MSATQGIYLVFIHYLNLLACVVVVYLFSVIFISKWIKNKKRTTQAILERTEIKQFFITKVSNC